MLKYPLSFSFINSPFLSIRLKHVLYLLSLLLYLTFCNLSLLLTFFSSSWQCHVSIVPVYSSLHKRSLPRFTRVIIPALLTSCTAYTLSGIFGSLTFGSDVCSDVLLSYHGKNITIMIARVMALANMLTTYPILHFCGRWVVLVQELFLDICQLIEWIVIATSLDEFVAVIIQWWGLCNALGYECQAFIANTNFLLFVIFSG